MLDKFNDNINFIKLKNYTPQFFINPNYNKQFLESDMTIDYKEITLAIDRMERFSKFFKKCYGVDIIESELLELKNFKKNYNVYLKLDCNLPISGSVKARGGIYEVLKNTEDLLDKYDIKIDDYSKLLDDDIKQIFNKHKIIVGSTGNLGLSIGIISKALNFDVTVHMSSDAKKWKMDKLKDLGCNVICHKSDYSKAVLEGRKEAKKDSNAYFIDDENSINLFLGYSTAAIRLKTQFEDMDIIINEDNPLTVYIPCGVGGAPSGIAYGLKYVFKENVNIIFIEPTHSPCMLLGYLTNTHDLYSVFDIGLDNITIADGLAVARASKFAGKTVNKFINGISTVNDDTLINYLNMVYNNYNIFLEPSAAAGFKGFEDYISSTIITDKIKNGIHIIWATGGSMVPENERKLLIRK